MCAGEWEEEKSYYERMGSGLGKYDAESVGVEMSEETAKYPIMNVKCILDPRMGR